MTVSGTDACSPRVFALGTEDTSLNCAMVWRACLYKLVRTSPREDMNWRVERKETSRV